MFVGHSCYISFLWFYLWNLWQFTWFNIDSLLPFQLFDGILLTLPRQSGGQGKSPQETIQDLAEDILSKLPQDFNMEFVRKSHVYSYHSALVTAITVYSHWISPISVTQFLWPVSQQMLKLKKYSLPFRTTISTSSNPTTLLVGIMYISIV